MSDEATDVVDTESVPAPEADAAGTAEAEAAEAPPTEPSEGEIPVYDFRRPRTFAPDRIRRLESIHGGLCKSLERWLATRVRERVALTAEECQSVTLEAYAESMSSPTAAFLFQVDESGRQAVIDLGREFAFYLVDRLLGSNDAPRLPERPLTVLERMLVRGPVEHVAAQLAAAWKDEAELTPELTRFEAHPAMLQAGNREELMLVAPIAVSTVSFEGRISLALPQMSVEGFFAPPVTKRRAPPPMVPPGVESSLRDVQMAVSVHTAPFSIRLGELARIEPGCTLETGIPSSSELTVRVEGIARFQAAPGRSGQRLAARITDVLVPAQQIAMETKGRAVPMASIIQDQDKNDGSATPVAEGVPGAGTALSSLYQVSLPITIELGRARMSVQEILGLARGAVIELDRAVGEPVNVMVGDRHYADGEVVVVGENFGVRITRVVTADPAAGDTP